MAGVNKGGSDHSGHRNEYHKRREEIGPEHRHFPIILSRVLTGPIFCTKWIVSVTPC
jgi:hypothetical protein